MWVGNASITQVGNYLKTYAKATNAVDFTNQLATLSALNADFQKVAISAGLWTPHDILSTEGIHVASSADGARLVAVVKDGRIQTSTDGGVTWTARETVRNWRSVASSDDGTRLVAAAFGGYLYTSTDAGVTWTFREDLRDWTSVASSSDGLKLVAVASQDAIYTSTDAGLNWDVRASNHDWTSVASSADGTKLVACALGDQIYTSTDAGLTWVARETVRSWTAVASSADGVNLVAVAINAQLYTSTDSGLTWVPQETSRNWTSVASSADGVNLVAGTDGGKIYTSTDSGVTWTPRDNDHAWISIASSSTGAKLLAVGVDSGHAHLFKSTDAGTNWNANAPYVWSCLASSSDGTNLVAAVSGGQIYTSSDAGQGWQLQPLSPSTNWQSVASSADGVKLAAAVKGGAIYTSANSGVNWSSTSAPNADWQSIASSDDGLKLVAVVDGGDIYTSVDGGSNWIKRSAASNQSWQSVASSADGKKLLAAAKGGNLFSSANSGANWLPLFGAPTADWKSVASSSDGKMLVAVQSPGGLYTSIDSGATWDLKASAPLAADWQLVASSKNGNALVAVVKGGRIYNSPDAGKTWAVGETNRVWASVTSSGDGSKLVAGEAGGFSQLYTTVGTLTTPKLVYDTNSNLILSGGGKYLTATFDTELGNVPAPFPLRLIVHQGADGVTKLLQHVFVGPDKVTSNSIITLDETKLHSGLLSQARRISAVHLPLSNTGWVLNGDFGGVGIMNTVLTDGYDNQSSNPFVHSYHPDHDNLDALFKPIGRAGVESYDIKRQITLSFTPPGDDFTSRTVGSSSVQGTYLENIVLKGSENQTRTVVTKGTFILNRVSSIPSIQ